MSFFKSEEIIVLDDTGHPADIEVNWVKNQGMALAFIRDSQDPDHCIGVYSDELDNLIEALKKVRQEMKDHVCS